MIRSVFLAVFLAGIVGCGTADEGTNVNRNSDRTAADRVADCDSVDDDQVARFKVDGDALIMNGLIDTPTPDLLRRMLARHAGLRRIVLECVYGSVDDDANLEAARLVRAKGLDTHLASRGEIASGGTDFFLAGRRRTAGSDISVGVHSWATEDDGPPLRGDRLGRDHPEHQKYLDYYREMGIPVAFYWFTLKAAPPDSVHNMTATELRRYRILTD